MALANPGAGETPKTQAQPPKLRRPGNHEAVGVAAISLQPPGSMLNVPRAFRFKTEIIQLRRADRDRTTSVAEAESGLWTKPLSWRFFINAEFC